MHTILILAALTPGQVQFLPEKPAQEPAAKLPHNAVARKEARDQVLRSVGKDALTFTKKYGDLGIASLQQCSPESGKKLVALFNAGEFGKLKNPRAVLEAVRQHGDPAAAWLSEYHEKLADPEALECWVKNPLEFVFDLKDVEQAAEELRASRKFFLPPWLGAISAEWNGPSIVIGVLVVFLLVSVFWKRKPAAS